MAGGLVGWQVGGWFLQIMPLSGSILQAQSCKIFSLGVECGNIFVQFGLVISVPIEVDQMAQGQKYVIVTVVTS